MLQIKWQLRCHGDTIPTQKASIWIVGAEKLKSTHIFLSEIVSIIENNKGGVVSRVLQ